MYNLVSTFCVKKIRPMLTHNIQRKIIRGLALHKALSFAELRPAGTESNVFTYHLNTLIKEGYVDKVGKGNYELTALGKMLGINSHLTPKEWLSQAHAVVFVTVFDPKKGWLVRRRKAQPMYDYVGFLHFEPVAAVPMLETAQNIVNDKVGIHAVFEPRGFGYARFFKDGDLQSFTTYTIVGATSFEGDITKQTETGESYWASYDEIKKEKLLLPTMLPIMDKLLKEKLFFLDMNFEV